MRRTLSFLFLVLAAATLVAQEPFREELDVDLVLVDVTVTDSRGNQILGLTKDDFILREEGTQREIESIDYFTNRRLLTAQESDAAFAVERVRRERYFILFFHELGDPTGIPGYLSELLRAKQAAVDWVENELQPQDLVAVAGYDARLKVYADFTNDKKVLRNGLEEMVKFSRGLAEVPPYAGEASIMKNLDVRTMMNRTGRIYDAIALLADAVHPIPARKVLTLVSPGIGDPSSFSPRMLENEEQWYRPMIRALNGANVTVNAIAMLRSVSSYAPEQTLSRMANESGGEFFKTFVSFETPLDQIEKASSGYYLLTYRIRKPRGEHGYQRIDVSLKNPEFQVRARDGYSY